MGEYAEYILNGDDCQYCGEYLGEGDGYPRSCASCAKDDKQDKSKASALSLVEKQVSVTGQLMGKKLRKALCYPKDCQGGMYEGCYWDSAPSMLRKLEKWGFVEDRSPHNGIHKSRCVLTEKGEAAYKAIKAGKPVYI